ncbi:recombinase family protein [Streptomyces sp. NPDC001848]|uniref:recombinase family protein n=1 Tax=Streptomyces sp. NPDC001848 TaxID=3364618 RepID=UPI00368D0792
MPFNSANATLTAAPVAPSTLTGREYLRVSQDSSGRQRSVSEQHDDNARATTDHGITLGEPYVDNDKSASMFATKERDDFRRLITKVRG